MPSPFCEIRLESNQRCVYQGGMATDAIQDLFQWQDWVVLVGYLLLTTWVGHLMRGKQASIKDFFLGGRSLPWQAVSGSIIATEISGVTFIGVPGIIFAANGNFTYLQWAIGSIIARILIARFFVRVYYEQEIYSPYDYMGRRLGNLAKTLATVLFTVGSILAQSVRVLVAAIPLQVVTGLAFEWCIVGIGLFAIVWTLMGGMRTVIWTDVLQFLLFTFGGLLALGWIVGHLDGGFPDLISTAKEFGRFEVLDTRLQKDLQFTLWVALFAVPFQNLGIFGTDQLMAQRMFCCRDAKSAGKAIIWSSVGQLLTLLMLLVGAALFVHYHENPFSDTEIATLFGVNPSEADAVRQSATLASNSETGAISNVMVPAERDYVFPIWIVSVLPVGLSGLILAGVFAAAISSLDSILAALSQTTLSLIYHPERGNVRISESQLVSRSRLLVVIWGFVLTGFTLVLKAARETIEIVPLAFGLTSYTVGPLLALFLASLWGKGSLRGLIVGAILSFVLVLFVRTDIWILFIKGGLISAETLAKLPTYQLNATGDGLVPTIAYVWMWPITTALTLACGLLLDRGKKPVSQSA